METEEYLCQGVALTYCKSAATEDYSHLFQCSGKCEQWEISSSAVLMCQKIQPIPTVPLITVCLTLT